MAKKKTFRGATLEQQAAMSSRLRATAKAARENKTKMGMVKQKKKKESFKVTPEMTTQERIRAFEAYKARTAPQSKPMTKRERDRKAAGERRKKVQPSIMTRLMKALGIYSK